MPRRKSPDFQSRFLKSLAVGWLFLSLPAGAIDVVVQLKNGDRLTGQLVTQETNHVVIATSWADSLVLPIAAIGGIRTAPGEVLFTPATTPAPSPASSPTTSTVAQTKPNPVSAAQPGKLTTTANLGLDLLFGAKERQIYYARIKSTYEHPYESNPRQYFRTIADYMANYGETDGEISANNMAASVQTDFDFGPVYYFYNAANVGYDQIRKIDLLYGVGPGIGRHLYTKPAFVLNVDGGVNYQVQKRSEGESPQSAYLRLGDNLTWKLADRVTLSKKFDFLLSCENASEFRFRLDSTLSYRLWNSLSLNLSFLDLYDTDPAPGVDQNEVQLRSSLGFTF
jgi:putative salt-induced outer membrane protein YdiY